MFAHAAASVSGHVTVPAAASSRAPRSRASSSGAACRPPRQMRRAGTAVSALDLNVVELAQVAVDDDLIPNLAIAASLGAILYASAGSLKGFAALLGGEEATASHILVKDPSLATSLLERLQEGPQDNLEVGVVLFLYPVNLDFFKTCFHETDHILRHYAKDRFAREAGKYSECPSKSKGGSLGTFKPGQMVKEFNDAVFNGPVGVIQGPVKTQFGYHLILVTDRTEKEA